MRFPTGRLPVTPVVRGKPVQLVSTPAEGVPSAGVVNDGDTDRANVEPVPVVARLRVMLPAVVTGEPVTVIWEAVMPTLVTVPLPPVAESVVPENDRPLPIMISSPMPPPALPRPASNEDAVKYSPGIGRDRQLESVPAEGVPMFGVVSTGELARATVVPVPEVARPRVMLPLLVIGEPDTVRMGEAMPTLVTVPLAGKSLGSIVLKETVVPVL